MNLTKKIGIGVTAIVFVVSICVLFTQSAYTDVYSEFKQVEYETMPTALDLLSIENSVQEIRGLTLSYIITGNIELDGKSQTEIIQETITAIEVKKNAFVEHESNIDVKAQLKAEEIDSLIVQLISNTKEVVDQKNHGAEIHELNQIMTTTYQPCFDSLVTLLDEQTGQHQASLGQSGVIVDAGYKRGMWLIRFCGFVAVAASVVSVYLLTKVSFNALTHINHLTQTLTAVSNINRLTVQEKDRNQLMQTSCEFMTKSMAYDGVWIGLADNAGNLTSVTAAGIDITSYFEIKKQFSEFSITSTPCERDSRVQLVSGESQLCAGCPIKNDDDSCDTICTRLYHEDRSYGMMMSSMPKESAQPYALAFFEEAASTLGHALSIIENETALTTKEELLNNSIDSILLHDMDGKILYYNDAAYKSWGYTRRQLNALSLTDLFLFEDNKLPFSVSSLSKGVIKYDATSITKEKKSFPTELQVKSLTLGDAQLFLTVVRDNTDKKLVEDELLMYTQHLSQLVEEKTREIIDAERMSAISKIASMVAHDLRGPLAVINSTLYIMKKGLSPNEETIPKIEDAVKYANTIIEEFRVSTKGMESNIDSVEIEPFLANLIGAHDNSVHLDIQTDVGEWRFDEVKIRRVLDNLLRNAFDAVIDGGHVSMSVKNENRSLEISVTDTGCGMSKEVMSNLFHALYTTKSTGTGLGLSYCKRTVEEHGGHITVESKLGEGTTFTIRIPDAKHVVKQVETISDKSQDDSVYGGELVARLEQADPSIS